MTAINPESCEETIKAIQEAVASIFGLSVDELRGTSSRHVIAVPRQIAMYLAKQITNASLPEIGRRFGDKHHTTVMHSLAKIHQVRATDAGMNTLIETLLKKLTSQSG
jgi:chromosomal replication initiator protein